MIHILGGGAAQRASFLDTLYHFHKLGTAHNLTSHVEDVAHAIIKHFGDPGMQAVRLQCIKVAQRLALAVLDPVNASWRYIATRGNLLENLGGSGTQDGAERMSHAQARGGQGCEVQIAVPHIVEEILHLLLVALRDRVCLSPPPHHHPSAMQRRTPPVTPQ